MSKPAILRDKKFNRTIIRAHSGQAKASALKRERRRERRQLEAKEAAQRGVSVFELRLEKGREAEHFRHKNEPVVFRSDSPYVPKEKLLKDMARDYRW